MFSSTFMKILNGRITVFLLIAGVLLVITSAETQSTGRKTVVVTDAQNRKVSIDLPLNRVVTINTSSATLMRALGADLLKKVVGVTSYMPENPDFWPELKDKPAFKWTNLSYEKLAELNPQLIILYSTANRYTQEKKLETLGTKWLYLDCFNPETLDKDIRLLGSLFGRENKAEELIQWYKNYDQVIRSRLPHGDSAKRPRIFYYSAPDLFIDKGVYRTINRHSSSHPVVEGAGGINLGADILNGQTTQVSAEWIAESNPEVIIADVQAKTFSGYSADSAVAVRNMKNIYTKLINNKALRLTDAVKNKKVLVISHDSDQGPSYVFGMSCIAKFLYPDRFRDIVPEKIACEYFKTWCGLPCRGVFTFPEFQRSTVDSDKTISNSKKGVLEIIDDAGGK